MAVIVALTGAAGFLASVGLLELGFERMWLRYLLSLLAAYLVFLCCVRIWMRLHENGGEAGDAPDWFDGEPSLLDWTEVSADSSDVGSGFGGGGASAYFGQGSPGPPAAHSSPVAAHKANSTDAVPDLGGLDADELALPLAALAALAAALFASAFVVYGAPVLLAELLLDGLVAGGLYRRLRRQPPGAWYAIALRKTLLPFAATGLVFVLAGWFVQSRLPEALTLGDVVRHGQQAK